MMRSHDVLSRSRVSPMRTYCEYVRTDVCAKNIWAMVDSVKVT